MSGLRKAQFLQSAKLVRKMVITNLIRTFVAQDFNMFLNRLTLHNFKNIADAQLEFSDKINCISGRNGAGKTNLLDAVYYLSMTKSFFSSSDKYVYGYDAEETVLFGVYQMDGGTEEKIACSVKRNGEKTFKKGAKTYSKFAEHIGLLPIVMISPVDSSLINDSGEERRKYMNFILSQTDREYLSHIQSYNQLLLFRNKLLKEQSPQQELLETFTEKMAPHAQYVYQSRQNLCTRLLPMVQDFYSRLSSGAETVSMEYGSDLSRGSLTEILERDAQRDRILRFTSSGIQRDDISFLLDGHPIRKCGSQGQQKCFLLAMKLAQFVFMKEIYHRTPILLLDDVFDKLDMQRVEHLLKIVSTLDFGQIFITDCNKVRLDEISERLGAPCRNFTVEAGKIVQSC